MQDQNAEQVLVLEPPNIAVTAIVPSQEMLLHSFGQGYRI
jgi:hypothetical protein